MALPQDNKAVFYHPLDNPTESLKSKIWGGSGTFLPGKVGSALFGSLTPAVRSHLPTLSFGVKKDYLASSQGPLTGIAKLTPTTFVVCYSNGTTGLARVGTVTGTNITYGVESTFEPTTTGAIDPIDVAAMSPTLVAVVYQSTSLGLRNVKAGTVSGTNIAWGTGQSYFGSGPTSKAAITGIDTTKFVVTYRRNATSDVAAKVGTVTGSIVAFGSQKVWTGSGTNDTFDIMTLSTTKFVVLWHNDNVGGKYWGKVGTVTGTTIAFGTPTNIISGTGPTAAYITGDMMSLSSVFVAYRDGSAGGRGAAMVGTITGTNITFAPAVEFSAGDTTNVGVASLDPSRAVVTYRKEIGGDCVSKIANITGTAIAFSGETVFAPGNGGTDTINKTAALDATTFVISYRDNVNSGFGTAKVGTPSDPYTSAVGAGRVVFTSWTINPSTI